MRRVMVALLALLPSAPVSLGAQGTTSGYAQASVYYGLNRENVMWCDDGGAGSLDFSCSTDRIVFRTVWQGRTASGQLGASLFQGRWCFDAHHNDPAAACGGDFEVTDGWGSFAASAVANTRWDDRLAWSAPQGTNVASVIFEWAVDGRWSVLNYSPDTDEMYPDEWLFGSGSGGLYAEVPAGADEEGSTMQGAELFRFEYNNQAAAGSGSVRSAGQTVFDVGGRSDLVFWMSLNLNSLVSGVPDSRLRVDSDFYNTLGLTGVAFLDAAGNDVTQQVSYQFDQGTQFLASDTSVAPEPVSTVLLGTGLAGMFALRRRRRSSGAGNLPSTPD